MAYHVIMPKACAARVCSNKNRFAFGTLDAMYPIVMFGRENVAREKEKDHGENGRK